MYKQTHRDMETLINYLKENDNQSLIGSLLQYGFTSEQLTQAEQAGIIEVRDSLVYLLV